MKLRGAQKVTAIFPRCFHSKKSHRSAGYTTPLVRPLLHFINSSDHNYSFVFRRFLISS